MISWQSRDNFAFLLIRRHNQEIDGKFSLKGTVSRASTARAVKDGIGSWLGVAMMVLLLVLASGSGDLFLYSPDIGLHTLPTLQHQRGLPAHGTIVEDSVVSPALSGQIPHVSIAASRALHRHVS